MTTPAYPNQIRMSQIRTEVKNPSTNQDLSLGGYRAGQGKVVAGAIGYPEGIRTEIPGSGAISMGNFHSFTNFTNQTSQQILSQVFSNLPNYFRYQMFNADGATIPYPSWVGSTGQAWSGTMNNVRETNSVGGVPQGSYANLYFDGTAGSRNNNDGSIPTLSEWTTYVSFSSGWSPVFNNRTTPSVNVYKNVNGVDVVTELYRIAGYWGNLNVDPSSAEPGGTASLDCSGWHMNVYWIPEKLTTIKRATQRVSAGSGTNRPSGHGAIMLPGKWTVTSDTRLTDYVTPNQTCRVYRDDNTNLPFRIQTYSGTNPTSHRMEEGGDDDLLISSQRKFSKWRFLSTNTTTMAPIVTTKEYIVETIDDSQFYIRDPSTGSYVYPTTSYAVGNANRNATITVSGGICRKKLSSPPGTLQFLFNGRANNQDFVYEYNTPFHIGYLQSNPDWSKNGPGTAGWHPEEIGDSGLDRNILQMGRRDDTNSNLVKLWFNTTNTDQINTYKCTPGITRFFFGGREASTRRLNLRLESLF